MQRLFFSSIKTYSLCPLQYKYTYIDRIQNEKLVLKRDNGKIIHKMLELLAPNPTFDGLECISNETLMIFSKKYPFEQIMSCIAFVKRWFSLDKFPHRVVETEKRFSVVLRDTFVISGVVDRVDEILPDKYNIIDYKTGDHIYGYEDIQNSLQLRIYAYAIFNLYPFLTSTLISYHNIKTGDSVSIEITRDEIVKIEEILYNYLCGLFLTNQKEFNAFTGPHCIYCPHTNICQDFKTWIQEDFQLKEDMSIDEIADKYIWVNMKSNVFKTRRVALKNLLFEVMKSQGIKKLDRNGFSIIIPDGTDDIRVVSKGEWKS